MLGGSDIQMASQPIGLRLAGWRARRGLSVPEVAERCGLRADRLVDLESGRDWVDRHGLIAKAADVLRVDPSSLTGQPYPPADERQAAVMGVALRVRRVLGQVTPQPASAFPVTVDDLAVRVTQAAGMAASGDEFALALALPDLIARGEAAAASPGAPPGDRGRAERLWGEGLLLGAGLLRRLGYRDLAWVLLHKAKREPGPGLAIVVEEVRLLLACGRPDAALAHAARPTDVHGRYGPRPDTDHHPDAERDAAVERDLAVLVAFAHAMADRPETATRVLDAAEHTATTPVARAALAAARTVTAVESGEVDEVPDRLHAVDLASLPPAARADLLVAAAGAAARRGQIGEAAARLTEADRLAPLRVRLDPFARDLLTVLPSRTDDQDTAGTLRALATRVGLT
jgi:transcriptional regulator with XRE-family HTH domain